MTASLSGFKGVDRFNMQISKPVREVSRRNSASLFQSATLFSGSHLEMVRMGNHASLSIEFPKHQLGDSG